VRAKLKARRPITIVTMGDSLTDERHWANRETVWHKLLAAKLRVAYGAEVNVVNPAIGGTTLSQNAVLMPRWGAAAPTPDLVTVWFGGNDWDAGVRGPRFAQYLRLTIDRIRRQTGGSADVLLMTTAPSFARWQTATEMEQAVRDVAKEKGTGLADVAAAFHAPGTPEEALKQEYWAWDKVHLGAKGHAATADVVMKAIEGERK
jgi:lysophospholipase L1-like esterase